METNEFTALGVFSQFLRLKLLPSGEVTPTDRHDVELGTALTSSTAPGAKIQVLLKCPGIRSVRSETCKAGDTLYGQPCGMLGTSYNGNAIGRAVVDCENGHDVIDVEYF